mmetsp:Transcript_15139/g.39959  ORF Transcript_15139/g.39959 Transcript_15139/m.39959 type:complete len:141 (+) Transcript_15139:101-523(+)|eukprot:CAMPEP_0202352888 /NCGR_PEP_ID=MMETSP1126-20121109/8888_1 /ASSEMBLY_ACC=CAM_ASM_000457 /TAXON_ID=3047 /ORGANISM="Dunaliella tertiolecta, Strain CCMP1320" /LENGTH=140 /DNA_ID=CAMNT_0048945165 /DNA_START=24 /DNA_END=446 /DNA_ORIENTATION=+
MAAKDINELAKRELADAASYLFFEWDGSSANVLAHSFKDGPKLNELPAIAKSVDNRDEAIKHGLTLQGTRYEVHRHHPPLVYGRTMSENPEESVGIALCMVENTASGKPIFGLITYMMPNISARMVPILQQFCKEHLTTA